MALTTAQQVRSRIQDYPKLEERILHGDDVSTMFWLMRDNVTSGSAFVSVPAGWSATAATFNSSGYVLISAPIPAASALRTLFVHSVFSDEEIDHWIGVGGSVPAAAREAARTLLFDSLKRARWVASDGSEYDDSKALGLIRGLLQSLNEEIESDSTLEGGMIEWAMNQGDNFAF